MILKKLVISLSFLCILNGCAQNFALIGPAITGVSTGSIYQASLSYGSGIAIKQITGKTSAENIKGFLPKTTAKTKKKENNEEFFYTTKAQIKKYSEIKNLANQ